MFKNLKKALQIKDVRNKILFTLMVLVICRLGAQIPIPGVDRNVFTNWFETQTGGGLDFLNALTGGSFTQMSIFALSITPYITSSIIMQLLAVAIPYLEKLQEDEDGRKKMNQYTRIGTVALALIQGLAMGIGFYRSGNLASNSILEIVVVTMTLITGAMVLMWLGEQVTVKGIGNGISIILLINIVSRLPQDIVNLYDIFIADRNIVQAGLAVLIILAVILFMVVFVIYLQDGQRNIPVIYANASRKGGRRAVGGSHNASIPLKVNPAGVIPVIFAGSIMSLPSIIVSLTGANPTGIWGEIIRGMNQNNWFVPATPWYSIGLVVYIVLVFAFAYFYTPMVFNPILVAENIKKQGGAIPGIRAQNTAQYLEKCLSHIVFIGAAGLAIVCVVPIIFSGIWSANVSFAGTSLIIIVSVILETLKQFDAIMLSYVHELNYKKTLF